MSESNEIEILSLRESEPNEELRKGEIECSLGIDEAGRGPVLGPLVFGAAYWPNAEAEQLSQLGFADSKVLTEDKRDFLFHNIIRKQEASRIGWAVEVLMPEYLSACMLALNKYNLNLISHDAAISLIRRVLKLGVKLSHVYLDTVGPPEVFVSLFILFYF